jgi:hypothetical protein
MDNTTGCRLREAAEEVLRQELGATDFKSYFPSFVLLIEAWGRGLFVFDGGTGYLVTAPLITREHVEHALEPESHSGPTGRPTFVFGHLWARLGDGVTDELLKENRVVVRLLDDGTCSESPPAP